MTRLAYVLVAAAAAGGCLRATEHTCAADEQCAGGRCEASGWCSFADPGCAGGWRYGDGAGGLSGACVDGSGMADGPGTDGDVDAPDLDAPLDGPITADGPDAPILDVVPHVRAQDEGLGQLAIVFTSDVDYVINTTTLTISPSVGLSPGAFVAVPQDGGGPDLALLRASNFELDGLANIRVIGTRPLVVLARTIDLDGAIELGGQLDTPGPGGSGSDLGAGAGEGGAHAGTADSGGGGASFGTRGGNGGTSSNGNVPGGAAGMVWGDATVTTLHGGSGGGTAFQNPSCQESGRGGGGGGAIQMYASVSLLVRGPASINAGGGGGGGGECELESLAGGGGGSGGVIYLQSPSLMNQGILTAKGAGGGGAASPGVPGEPGQDGTASVGATPGGAPGGANAGRGGDGTGGGTDLAGDNGGNGLNNSGGGGGGAGRIVLRYRDSIGQGTTFPAAVLTTY